MPVSNKSPVNVPPPSARAPAASNPGVGKPTTAPTSATVKPATLSPPTAPAAQQLAAPKAKLQATPPSGPPPNDGFSAQPRARGGAGPSGTNANADKSFWSKMAPSNLFAPSAASQQKAAIKQDAATLQNVPGGFPGKDSLYHSTSSAAWDGMSKTGGLMPASMLSQQGIQRKTGEGDQFSPQAGEKDFISFGQGANGLGMSRAYYKQTEGSPSYNPQLYSDKDLQGQIDQSKRMLTKFNEPGKGEIRAGEGLVVDKTRVQQRLNHLEAEQALRKNMPARETPYPMMLDLKGDKLKTEANGTGAGEVAVKGPAMFKDNLQRVFVPADKVPDMKARLDATMGPGHGVQVMSFEGQTQHLEQGKLKGGGASNPAYLAMRNDNTITQGLNNNERNRQGLYDVVEMKLNKPPAP